MARKPLGPMDINEYYKAMGARPETDAWEMPIYNTASGKPVTGQGRQVPKNSGNFAAPVYNYQGKPVLSNKDNANNQDGSQKYRVEVIRQGTVPGENFKAPVYNDNAGRPIINDVHQGSGSQRVYRPSELKKAGTAHPSARKESLLAMGENKKLLLNNSFSADVPGAPLPIGNFTKISGLEVEWELETYREGGENSGDYFLPRQLVNSHIVFEYGIGFIDPLWKWFSMTNMGMMIKLPMLIYLMNEQKVPVKLWMALDAMPVKYSVPEFDAMASQVAISRLEFIHNGLINIL